MSLGPILCMFLVLIMNLFVRKGAASAVILMLQSATCVAYLKRRSAPGFLTTFAHLFGCTHCCCATVMHQDS